MLKKVDKIVFVANKELGEVFTLQDSDNIRVKNSKKTIFHKRFLRAFLPNLTSGKIWPLSPFAYLSNHKGITVGLEKDTN
jgi:hypothetical protein